MPLVTVIGRGHSGTRAISHTLYASGVFMGDCLNRSGDLIPPQQMYDACRALARHVKWLGDLQWDFDTLFELEPSDEFVELVQGYLKSVLDEDERHPDALKGWKIPETTLVYPWIQRLFPEARYIFWIRDPRDCILNQHKTDNLRDFGIDYPEVSDLRERRAISWKYQYDLVKATARPQHWLEVRFEDFVFDQEQTLQRLEDFLGVKLARIPRATRLGGALEAGRRRL
ncbi:MAG: sulfotransferase [Caldilineaceae bacterium]|nr:sulfotransferase [Caldilineaceae bacterium]